MYKVYDTQSAIREVQKYLSLAGDATIYVAPTGIYDDNTKLSVRKFQEDESLSVTSVVDNETFDLLYERYAFIKRNNETRENTDSFLTFPLTKGMSTDSLRQINLILGRLLLYYGFAHNLRASSYFSDETLLAVRQLREVYRLEASDVIDEEFYYRLTKDLDAMTEN